MTKKIILSIVILITVFSCGNKKKAKLIKINEISIESKFVPSLSNSGILMLNGKEYYFLSDITSYKEIALYNSVGKKVDSISLKNIIKNEGTLKAISVHNLDTIFCLSSNNNICLINYKGDFKRLFILNNETNNKYSDFRSSIIHGFYSDSKMFFNVLPEYDNNIVSSLSGIELTKYYLQEIYNTPHIVCIKNIFDTSNIKITNYLDS